MRTRAGMVTGFTDEGASVFLGVPYAAPPFGEHRFAPPAPVEPWDGVREALRHGPTAPQRDPGITIIPEPVERGEDCLNLNIFTPEPGDARLPVLVWIHGGGFVSGCNRSPWYRGTRFARDGVVVVNVGYRLGVEGFLDIDGAPPNRAVLDWIAALEWVRDNIAAFGGDPDRVTIGGQSAGSAACVILLTDPRARGLFRQAIAMSGTSDTRMPREASTELGAKIAAHLGVAPTREELAGFSPDALIEAHAAVATNPFSAEAMMTSDPRAPALKPYVDGEVIASHPFREIAAGVGADVPVLAGCTTEEINGAVRLGGVDEQTATAALSSMGLSGDRLARYLDHVGTTDVVEAFAQAASDRAFRVPLASLLEDRIGAPTFAYQFAWRSPLAGAAHCLDIPFVFDNLDAERVADGLIGADAPRELADRMHSAWVSFIRDGDPGWSVYDAERRVVMRFDDPSSLEPDMLGAERDLFAKRS